MGLGMTGISKTVPLMASEPEDRPNRVDRHVGRRLRIHRDLIGVSQAELAETLGITIGDLQAIESGRKRLAAETLERNPT